MKRFLITVLLAGLVLNISTSAALAKSPQRSTPTPSPTLLPTSTPIPSPTITPSPTPTVLPSPSPTIAQLTQTAQPKVLVSGRDLFLAALILFVLLYVGFLVREKLIVSLDRKLTKWQKKRS